ncbi:MAG: hypothetical protein J2P18_01710 [Nocardia sp.]|nr:hypothetical protein [Nocardia sp.]
MLLLLDEGAALSPPQERFADWVGWSPAQPGVAVMNVDLPHRSGTRHIDAIVWTRQRCIVVAPHSFRHRQDGALLVPATGPWRMDHPGGELAALHGNDPVTNPGTRLGADVRALRDWSARTTNRNRLVYGLILVMLLPNQKVPALHAPAPPAHLDVIVEDFDVFRFYLHRTGEQAEQWDADSVHTLITALDMAHLYGHRPQVIASALADPAQRTA